MANAYVDDALRRTEEAINSALNEVHESRVSFRSAANVGKEAAHTEPQVSTISEEELAAD